MQFGGLCCQCILPLSQRQQPKYPADSWRWQDISGEQIHPTVGKGKQEPFEKPGIICQAKLLSKRWGKATADEGKAKARLGGTHSPPAEDGTRGNVSSADDAPYNWLAIQPPWHPLLGLTTDVPKCYFDRRTPCKIPYLTQPSCYYPQTASAMSPT